MRLAGLDLRNFRGVQEGTISDFAAINILVGKNNSGKTTVLEALTRLANRYCHERNIDADILNRRMMDLWATPRNEREEYPPELWYRHDQEAPVSAIARLIFQPGVATQGDVTMSMRKTAPTVMQSVASDTFSENRKGDVLKFLKGVTLFRPQDGTNRIVELLHWPQLLTNRRDKALTRIMNSVFGLEAESFNLLPDQRLMILFEEFSVPLDVQGDGARTALRALMVLTLLEDTLFLMEEPECHQHPGSLERYAKAVATLAKEQRIQLVLTTHSAECTRAFLAAAKHVGSDSAVFHLSLDKGKQAARRLDADAVESLATTGVDVRFLDLYA